jgi:hypothetical protein
MDPSQNAKSSEKANSHSGQSFKAPSNLNPVSLVLDLISLCKAMVEAF